MFGGRCQRRVRKMSVGRSGVWRGYGLALVHVAVRSVEQRAGKETNKSRVGLGGYTVYEQQGLLILYQSTGLCVIFRPLKLKLDRYASTVPTHVNSIATNVIQGTAPKLTLVFA